MYHTQDHIAQSIVHVPNEWAKAAPGYHCDARMCPTDY